MVELDRDEAAIATADERVLTLKVLDRLHNMRTLQYLDEDKQRLKSRHTLEAMVPLARRLGLCDVSDGLASTALGQLAVLSEDAPAGHRALALGALLLPSAARARYMDEWLGELGGLPPGTKLLPAVKGFSPPMAATTAYSQKLHDQQDADSRKTF